MEGKVAVVEVVMLVMVMVLVVVMMVVVVGVRRGGTKRAVTPAGTYTVVRTNTFL